MSNPGDSPIRGPLIDDEFLRESGNPNYGDVDVPDTPDHAVVVDDDDLGECRWGTESELEPIYVDNIDSIESVQHDVWTLTVDDDEEFRLRTRAGTEAVVSWGDIEPGGGPSATRFRVANGVAWPTDEYGNVLINDDNTPRLAGLKRWMLDELAQRSEQRVEFAELVNTFSGIIGHYSGVFGTASSANQPGGSAIE